MTYTYDSADRLIKADYGATGAVTYTYDNAGHVIARVAPAAVLSIAKTHSGNFTAGQNGAAYNVVVSNTGNAPTSGTVTVTETVPAGLTLVSMAGTGWNCPSGGTTCTRSDPLMAGSNYAAITVMVNVAANAASPQVNAVSVAGGGATGANTTDSTVISVATTPITIQSSPAGLQFTVDGGAAQTAPQTLNLTQGQHTVAVATTQPGSPVGTQYVFTGWSDQGAATHFITVGATAGTYTASFKTQYQLTISASPAAGGTVTPSSGSYYDSGTAVPIAATANTGYAFTNWTGAVTSANSASTTVTMSAPETVTGNFSSVTGITIQTNPPGLQFTVDGGAVQTAPQSLNLSQGPHTIAVAATQAGPTGTQYVFNSWSDSGAASHSITVGASAATYTANFNTQYQLTISASPTAGGTVTPASGMFYDSGAVIAVTATANAGYNFGGWTGAVASASSASTTATMSAALTLTANFTSLTGITIQTAPSGLQFTVDGGAAQTAPQVLNLSQGAHTIAVASPQAGQPGTQYVFTGWSDGGAASHSITVTGSAASYTASFKTQYQLTISALPAAGGVVAPASGTFYDSATAVPITATANSGYLFSGWTGGVASASSASTTVTMSAAETVVGNFTAGQAPPAVTIFAPAQGAIGVALTTSLTWTGTAGATSYDVYFGTATTPPLAQANQTATTYSPTMAAGVTYYWSVTAKNAFGSTPSVIWSFTTAAATTAGFRFVPVTPCRVMDTRNANGLFGGPSMAGGATRNVPIPQSACNIPSTAQAYSLNVTVVPPGPLTYLSIWPAGVAQPVVSTLNSFDGRIVANAAIVPAGTSGAISLFVSNTTDVIIDINGYFVPAATTGSMSFYTATPCRVVDTRNGSGTFGGPFLSAGTFRSFAVPSSTCGIPSTAQAYSLNITAVPHGPLSYLTTWPSGQTQPLVSTLNSSSGAVVANAAIVPAGTNGAVSVFVTNDADVIIDINGYFAPPGAAGALSLYTLTPCRVADTRNSAGPFGGPSLAANATRNFGIPASACTVPSTAQAYSLNVTVVPPGPLTYLTAWPAGQTQPVVSTLNSFNGAVVANAAIVPAGASGGVSLFVSNATDVILDINAYFAQ